MFTITTDPEQAKRISLCASKLTLDAPFFAAILLRLLVVCTREVDTMATDGRHLFWNPDFVRELPPEEITGVLCHEVLHVADGHHLRIGSRNHSKWNEACDHGINPIVIEQSFKLPADALLDPKYKGMSAEQVYGKIEKEDTPPPDQPGTGEGEDAGEGSNDAPSKPSTDPGGCGGVLPATNEDGSPLSPADLEEAKRDHAEMVAEAVQAATKRGKMPGSLKERIETNRAAQVDWIEKIHNTVKGTVQSDYSWRRPNRRRLQDGIYLPSLLQEGVGEIVIGWDTSGSVSHEASKQYGSEVLAICEEVKPSRVHILYCDSRVHAETYEQDEIENIVFERKGGGGTSFVPVFDWVEDRIAEGEDVPQCLIYLTDGYGDAPEVEPDYPVLWVCTSNKVLPIGDTVRINV
jgi:predicted metal-dependent peptidase